MKKIKQRDFREYDDLLWTFLNSYRSYWESYKNDAEILWAGEHYLLIRTGMNEDKTRLVYLVDKAGLQYDENAPPLVQIASSIHPAQEEHALGHAIVLHESNQAGTVETVFEGRWCKKMRAKCIDYAEKQDALYDEELPGWILDYERRQAEAAELEKAERSFVARLLRSARKSAQSVDTRVAGESWDKGVYGDRCLKVEGTLGSDITFRASPDDWKVTVFGREHLFLTESQFKRYVRLLCKFHAENVEAQKKAEADD